MTINKSKLIIVITTLIILSVFLIVPYRNYIYTNNIEDFGLADVGYNIFVIPLMTFISWIGKKEISTRIRTNILKFSFITIGFELLSYYYPYFGTFDIKDILALIFSTLLAHWLSNFLMLS